MPRKKKAEPPKKPSKPKAERPEPKWTTGEAIEHLFPKPLIDKARHDLDSSRSDPDSFIDEE